MEGEKIVECINWREKVTENRNVTFWLGQTKRKSVILTVTEGVVFVVGVENPRKSLKNE